MLMCFRPEKVYKLLQFLGGRGLWALILWQIFPSISCSLSSSLCPPELIFHPSSSSTERDPGDALKDNLG